MSPANKRIKDGSMPNVVELWDQSLCQIKKLYIASDKKTTMSRYVFFYKLNSTEGKDFLYNDLTSKTKYEISFADFITERAKECGDSFEISYNQVITSISKDFNEIRPSELSEIVNWYNEQVDRNGLKTNADWEKNEEVVTKLLKRSGIELLFEITSGSTECYAFIFQYGNFSSKYRLNAFDEGDEGSNIKSYDFIRFLDYMILLMCKINEAGLDDTFNYSDSQLSEIKTVKLLYRDDIALLKLIIDEFERIKKYWIEFKKQNENDMREKITPQAHTVSSTYYFLRECLNMKAAINEENTNIVMVHG